MTSPLCGGMDSARISFRGRLTRNRIFLVARPCGEKLCMREPRARPPLSHSMESDRICIPKPFSSGTAMRLVTALEDVPSENATFWRHGKGQGAVFSRMTQATWLLSAGAATRPVIAFEQVPSEVATFWRQGRRGSIAFQIR